MTRYRAAAFLLTAALGGMAWCMTGSAASPSAAYSAALAEQPLVMRLSKDEFRIAFGLNARGCASSGCNGVIHYRVDWKSDDGVARSELRRVSYSVLPHYSRALTVDRQFFDTAEGAHTIAILKVTVSSISCVQGASATAPLAARNR
jgi:hypothetical protein